MQQNFRGGPWKPGGIIGYPLNQLQEEVAYLAYYFHWPLQDILEMEHQDRRQWADKIAVINRKMNESAG
jgi:hypothetical protein